MTAPPVVRLCPPGTACRRVIVEVEDRPGDEWLLVAIPAAADFLDDPTRTPRQVAVEIAAEARDTAEQVAYRMVLARRRGTD